MVMLRVREVSRVFCRRLTVLSLLFQLWVTEDFGKAWRSIGYYVKSFFISEFTSPPTLYIERRKTDVSAVLSTQDK